MDALSSETILRFVSFACIFAAMAWLELLAPRRRLVAPRGSRWRTNLTIVGLGIAIVRILGAIAAPLVAVGAAMLAEAKGWGLFNLLALPAWLEVGGALVVLDFAIWLQHVASHRFAVLWRFHRMHHADVDFDVTTALRFHPIEIAASMLYKVGWVLALGPSALAVVLFEIILNGCAIFNHSNFALPRMLDRALRHILVTPDMHRVHHSVIEREHNANYGFNLSIWDRWFGTYVPQPRDGHFNMRIGLKAYQSEAPTRLAWSLLLPFRASGRGDRGNGH